MSKFAILGSYSSDAWKRQIDNPKDRTETVRKLVTNAGGTLETFYLMLGADDFILIAEMPDPVSAAAVSIAVTSSGSFRNLRTIQLIEPSSAPALLAKAKTALGVYQAPGS